MRSIFQFDGFHLHFISLFLEKIPFVHNFLCSLVFIIPFPISGGGTRIWFSLSAWCISHPQSNLPWVTVHPSLLAPLRTPLPSPVFLISSFIRPPHLPWPFPALLFFTEAAWRVGILAISNSISPSLALSSRLTILVNFSWILGVYGFSLVIKKIKKKERKERKTTTNIRHVATTWKSICISVNPSAT